MYSVKYHVAEKNLMVIKFGGLPLKWISLILTAYYMTDQLSLLFAFLVLQSYKLGTSTSINIDGI